MSIEANLHYFCIPKASQSVAVPVEVLPVQEFLDDEPACKMLWDLISVNFRTRGKFLSVWPNVRFVALNRDNDGEVMGFLLISAAINWQIDYVVVRPEARGSGVATALVKSALNYAAETNVPYVMLTSRESLRPLYEACGFTVVEVAELVSG